MPTRIKTRPDGFTHRRIREHRGGFFSMPRYQKNFLLFFADLQTQPTIRTFLIVCSFTVFIALTLIIAIAQAATLISFAGQIGFQGWMLHILFFGIVANFTWMYGQKIFNQFTSVLFEIAKRHAEPEPWQQLLEQFGTTHENSLKKLSESYWHYEHGLPRFNKTSSTANLEQLRTQDSAPPFQGAAKWAEATSISVGSKESIYGKLIRDLVFQHLHANPDLFKHIPATGLNEADCCTRAIEAFSESIKKELPELFPGDSEILALIQPSAEDTTPLSQHIRSSLVGTITMAWHVYHDIHHLAKEGTANRREQLYLATITTFQQLDHNRYARQKQDARHLDASPTIDARLHSLGFLVFLLNAILANSLLVVYGGIGVLQFIMPSALSGYGFVLAAGTLFLAGCYASLSFTVEYCSEEFLAFCRLKIRPFFAITLDKWIDAVCQQFSLFQQLEGTFTDSRHRKMNQLQAELAGIHDFLQQQEQRTQNHSWPLAATLLGIFMALASASIAYHTATKVAALFPSVASAVHLSHTLSIVLPSWLQQSLLPMLCSLHAYIPAIVTGLTLASILVLYIGQARRVYSPEWWDRAMARYTEAIQHIDDPWNIIRLAVFTLSAATSAFQGLLYYHSVQSSLAAFSITGYLPPLICAGCATLVIFAVNISAQYSVMEDIDRLVALYSGKIPSSPGSPVKPTPAQSAERTRPATPVGGTAPVDRPDVGKSMMPENPSDGFKRTRSNSLPAAGSYAQRLFYPLQTNPRAPATDSGSTSPVPAP